MVMLWSHSLPYLLCLTSRDGPPLFFKVPVECSLHTLGQPQAFPLYFLSLPSNLKSLHLPSIWLGWLKHLTGVPDPNLWGVPLLSSAQHPTQMLTSSSTPSCIFHTECIPSSPGPYPSYNPWYLARIRVTSLPLGYKLLEVRVLVFESLTKLFSLYYVCVWYMILCLGRYAGLCVLKDATHQYCCSVLSLYTYCWEAEPVTEPVLCQWPVSSTVLLYPGFMLGHTWLVCGCWDSNSGLINYIATTIVYRLALQNYVGRK